MTFFFTSIRVLMALAVGVSAAVAQTQRPFDVQHYTLEITPELETKSVTGVQTMRLLARQGGVTELELDSGALTVDAVTLHGEALAFDKAGARTIIHLKQPLSASQPESLHLRYHGTPSYGMTFLAQGPQIHTDFSTSQWMPCVDAPEVRATLDITLVLPQDWVAAANGRLAARQARANGLQATQWLLEQPMPSYLYGFVAGLLREVNEQSGTLQLRQLAPMAFSEAQIRQIFRDTPDMLAFYEDKAGVKYPFTSYTQAVLRGYAAQEMAGMSILGERYGQRVLADEHNLWLGAHELAHTWWGNGVTNLAWTHFWPNEGIASFMTAAYIEHRFGRAAYMEQINAARAKYEAVLAAGNDKPLVFPNWDKPSASDRSLVYDKGAYVTHLLRQQMGEEAFWRGLRNYTRLHWGRSVTTRDFQAAMEQAHGQSLAPFFAKWVYLTAP
jgi:aminopeptidase N